MSDWIVVGILGFSLTAMYLLGWLSSELFNTRREVRKIMAEIDEKLDAILEVVTQTSGTADSIVALVAGLRDQIAELLTQVGTSPDTLAKANAIFEAAIAAKAKLDTAVNA